MLGWRSKGLIGVAILVASASSAHAQVSAPNNAYQDAFDRLAGHLDDPEASFDFAQQAIAAGDISGAIAALERVLRLDPSRDNIRLELGLLYARVDRADLAVRYIEEALTAPDMPDYVRARAQAQLHEIQEGARGRSTSGSLYAGVLHQSNPNATPDSALVFDFLRGRTVQLDADDITSDRDEDWALVLSANAEHRVALETARPSELVIDGSLYGSFYDQTEGLDALAADARIGPRFYGGDAGRPDSAVRPFVSAGALALDGDLYFTSAGAGLVYERKLTPRTFAGVQMQWEHRDFSNSGQRPRAEDQSGAYYGAGAHVQSAARGINYTLRLGVDRGDADLRSERFSRREVSAAFSRVMMQTSRGPVRAGFTLRYRNTEYDAPDPFVSPDETRIEDRYVAGANVETPIARRTRLALRLDQTWNRATLPNYRYDDTSISLGIARDF